MKSMIPRRLRDFLWFHFYVAVGHRIDRQFYEDAKSRLLDDPESYVKHLLNGRESDSER
jgi:hypothetical protein